MNNEQFEEIRTFRGLSKAELSRHFFVESCTVHRWSTGESRIPAKVQEEMTRLLHQHAINEIGRAMRVAFVGEIKTVSDVEKILSKLNNL